MCVCVCVRVCVCVCGRRDVWVNGCFGCLGCIECVASGCWAVICVNLHSAFDIVMAVWKGCFTERDRERVVRGV